MNDESDWDPFGRPIFEDAAARALARVGVVDVGSNSVRLVVFDGAARSPAYFYNEKVMCALGRGLGESGALNPEGRVRALAALRRFALLAEAMGIAPLTAVATAAVRDAADGPDFRAEVERETGLRLWVIDGRQEARLSAQGVLLGWPGATGLLCDIGGSSMEMAELRGGVIGRRETSALGPLSLQREGGAKARRTAIDAGLERLAAAVGGPGERIFLVGGSWRAISRLDMIRRDYPLAVLHEYTMSPEDARATVAWIGGRTVAELRALSGIGEARMSLVPLAAEVLDRLIPAFAPSDLAVSSYGIREGMLYEQMPAPLRARDPLIEAARFMESKDARMPGFGKALYRFLLPLWEGAPPERLRLIRAACLLHDVSWRAHPDYRSEVSFETATRSNLGGLSHPERVFLGAALAHRYKNARSERIEPLLTLLDAEMTADAERLGKAMRFGAMLSVSDPAKMGRLGWDRKARRLTFTMEGVTLPLFGEVARARLGALAAAMGAELELHVGEAAPTAAGGRTGPRARSRARPARRAARQFGRRIGCRRGAEAERVLAADQDVAVGQHLGGMVAIPLPHRAAQGAQRLVEILHRRRQLPRQPLHHQPHPPLEEVGALAGLLPFEGRRRRRNLLGRGEPGGGQEQGEKECACHESDIRSGRPAVPARPISPADGGRRGCRSPPRAPAPRPRRRCADHPGSALRRAAPPGRGRRRAAR